MNRLYKARVLGALKGLATRRAASGPPFDMNDIQQQIMLLMNIDSVTFTAFPPRGDGVLGRYKVFYEQEAPYAVAQKTHAKIGYSNELNICWQRFVICKELCHIFWHDAPEFRSTSAAVLMSVVGALTGKGFSSSMAPAILTEDFAVTAAIDLLFPLEARIAFEADYREGKITALDIAHKFRIPEHYVRESLHPDFHDMAKQFWSPASA